MFYRRVELSCYSFDIVYRPGKENVPPDAFSRSTCAALPNDPLYLHQSLCHPGNTRMSHFVRARNLPYSIEEIKIMTNACQICCECKPRFHRLDRSHLIKATQAFERLNINFKGPLASSNKNIYFLNVIDEYSPIIHFDYARAALVWTEEKRSLRNEKLKANRAS